MMVIFLDFNLFRALVKTNFCKFCILNEDYLIIINPQM